jgi:hypothetical protein
MDKPTQMPPPTAAHRILKACGMIALSGLLVLTGPQARAADVALPPEQTVMVARHPQAPITEGSQVAPRQQQQQPADEAGRVVVETIFSTLVMIAVGALVCAFTGVCIVTM